MPSAQEVVDKARQLIERSRSSEKCLTEAKAVEDGINELKEATKLTTGDVLGFVGAGLSIIGGIASLNPLGGVAVIGGCFAALGVGWAILERVKKAKDALEQASKRLEDCLAQP